MGQRARAYFLIAPPVRLIALCGFAGSFPLYACLVVVWRSSFLPGYVCSVCLCTAVVVIDGEPAPSVTMDLTDDAPEEVPEPVVAVPEVVSAPSPVVSAPSPVVSAPATVSAHAACAVCVLACICAFCLSLSYGRVHTAVYSCVLCSGVWKLTCVRFVLPVCVLPTACVCINRPSHPRRLLQG